MEFLTENYKREELLVPQVITSGLATTGTYFSAGEALREMVFICQHSAIEEGKKLKVEILNAPDLAGTDANVVASADATGTGFVQIRLDIYGGLKEYFSVRVETDNTDGATVACIAEYPVKYSV